MHRLGIFIFLLSISLRLCAATYTQHTIDITPLMFGLGQFTFGFNPHGPYKASNGFIVTDVEKMARGYSGELGYLIRDNLEIKTRVSYIEDKRLGALLDVYPLAYQYNNRSSWGFSVGLNRYFDIASEHWLPFVGVMGGFIFQKSTNAIVYSIDTNGNVLGLLGNATLEGSKRRSKASINIGADYRFSKRWAIGFTTGLSYLGHSAASQNILFGFPTTFQDSEKKLTVPFYVSIKNLIP